MKLYIKALLNKRNLIDEKLQKYRTKCPHIHVDEFHKGNTGNIILRPYKPEKVKSRTSIIS